MIFFQMNTIEIGKELKKLVFKRLKGGPGEHVYVLVATKEEVDGGKNEVLNLLKEDIESWENVSRLRLKSESGDAFDKKVKKQIPFVLQEEQFKSLISRPEESVNSPKPKKAKLDPGVSAERDEKPTVDQNKEAEEVQKFKDVENITIPEDDELDVKPVRSFELAELPRISETIKVEDQDEINDDENNTDDDEVNVIFVDELMAVKDSTRKVLVFQY